MNAKNSGKDGQMSRRAFIRGPVLLGGSALALTQMGCDILESAEVGEPIFGPLTSTDGLWTVGELSFRGDFTESDRYGVPEIRAIDPRIVSYDGFGFEIERYDAATGRGTVFVGLDRAEEAYLFASRGTLTYQQWMPNTAGFAERLQSVYGGVGIIRGRGSSFPILRSDLEVTHIQLVGDDNGRPHRLFAKSPVVGLSGGSLVISGQPLAGARSVAEGTFPLDAVRLVKIEARDARSPGSLIKITAAASEAGRLVGTTRDVLGAVHML